MSGSNKIKEIVIDRILELCAKDNLLPWTKTWTIRGGLPCNLDNKRPYRGANAMMLMMAPFSSPYYLTFTSIKKRGITINKGERPWPIYFAKWPKKGEEIDPITGKKAFPIVRYYKVWNIEQLNWGDKKMPQPKELNNVVDTIAACEALVASYKDGPVIEHTGNMACYFPTKDLVQLPPRDQFKGSAEYYNTLFHELGHSTGSIKRLKREGITDKTMFGSHKYSREELVAEFTAAMLCATVGIEKTTIENSAAYIKTWLKVLNDDKTLLFDAAQDAQKAVDMISGTSFEVSEAASDEEEKAA